MRLSFAAYVANTMKYYRVLFFASFLDQLRYSDDGRGCNCAVQCVGAVFLLLRQCISSFVLCYNVLFIVSLYGPERTILRATHLKKRTGFLNKQTLFSNDSVPHFKLKIVIHFKYYTIALEPKVRPVSVKHPLNVFSTIYA